MALFAFGWAAIWGRFFGQPLVRSDLSPRVHMANDLISHNGEWSSLFHLVLSSSFLCLGPPSIGPGYTSNGFVFLWFTHRTLVFCPNGHMFTYCFFLFLLDEPSWSLAWSPFFWQTEFHRNAIDTSRHTAWSSLGQRINWWGPSAFRYWKLMQHRLSLNNLCYEHDGWSSDTF
jgi:hypothetical protein